MGVSSLWRKRIFEFLTFSDSLFQMDIDSLVCVALTTNLQRFSSSISSPFSSIQKDPLASGPPSIRLFFPIPFVPSVSSVQRERERGARRRNNGDCWNAQSFWKGFSSSSSSFFAHSYVRTYMPGFWASWESQRAGSVSVKKLKSRLFLRPPSLGPFTFLL